MARFGPIGNSDLSVIKFYLPSFAPTEGRFAAFIRFALLIFCLFYLLSMRCVKVKKQATADAGSRPLSKRPRSK